MESEKNKMTGTDGPNTGSGCGCDGDCSTPKKKSPVKTILFIIIILAAAGIIAFKVISNPQKESGKQSCTPAAAAGCDTTKKATCDTTKGSSCCPKK